MANEPCYTGNAYTPGLPDATVQAYQSVAGLLTAFGTPVAAGSIIHESPTGDGTYTVSRPNLVAALLAQTPSNVFDPTTFIGVLAWRSATLTPPLFDTREITPDVVVPTSAGIATAVAADLAGSPIVYTGPMTATGDTVITIGDDYYYTDPLREIGWDISPSVADLTGATVTLTVPSVGISGLTVSCTVRNAGLSNQRLYVPALTSAQTALFTPGNAPFYLLAVLADMHVETPLRNGNIEAQGRVESAIYNGVIW